MSGEVRDRGVRVGQRYELPASLQAVTVMAVVDGWAMVRREGKRGSIGRPYVVEAKALAEHGRLS